ncbi:unnamed protein product [Acanthoscelides obtectus]|uniref:Uncharacterized protein n=1 Tax=Acanthoscelides obtectus TaxID=200917 RepID=A0A9P0L5C6_ACAOB|nr:unnamed protein product [Acanthoscelides obtectus]CAK1650562.1 hypothetical protein AOBTE_LOCUS16808 [Acanthoscelides obtectus]
MESVSNNIKRIFQKAFKQLQNNSSDDDKRKWIKSANSQIRILNKAIRKKEWNHGILVKFQSDLCYFKHFRNHLKSLLGPHCGRGISKKRSDRLKWEDVQSAFSSRVRTGVTINLKHKDIVQFLNDAFFLFKSRITNILKTCLMIKVNTVFCGEFIKKAVNEEEERSELKYFNTKNEFIDCDTTLTEWFAEFVIEKFFNKLQEFSEKDSGFALSKIIHLEVNINQSGFSNNAGSSYIRLPQQIAIKNACVNVKNYDDNACFLWAIISALYPVAVNADRSSSYPHYSSGIFNLDGIETPVSLADITRFEKNIDISFNIFILELTSKNNYVTSPARLCKNKRTKHLNLLLIQNIYYPNNCENIPNDTPITYHYCWIKNLSRLVSSQTNKHHGKKVICDRCLNYFSSKEQLVQHDEYCVKRNNCRISFSSEKHIQFKNFITKQKLPTVYHVC